MEKERDVLLRKRIEELVRSRVGLLEQDISRLQGDVNESFTRLLERMEATAAVAESDQTLAQIAAEMNAQVDKAAADSVRLGADIALLRDSVAELEQQHTQAEVLNALVARAANFAPRVVLFVIKGGNALAWAARGFEDSVGNNTVRGLSISLDADTALRTALNAQQTFYGSPEQQGDNRAIFGRVGNLSPQRVLAVPLRVRGKSAAIIYADSADNGEGATNVEAIELLVQTAGLVVELVSLRARMSEAPQAPAQPAAQSSSAAAESRASGRLRVDSGSLPHHAPPQPQAGFSFQAAPANSGDLRQTAQPPAFFRSAEPAPPPPVDSPRIPESQPMNPSVLAHAAPNSEEEKQHTDARRFARLLVSEIKLYNEQKVSEGRRNNDLYDRLKEDIDKSRQMYEKRVAPVVAGKFDYFYDELVNTLAEGDPAKLGSDHPGPSVNV